MLRASHGATRSVAQSWRLPRQSQVNDYVFRSKLLRDGVRGPGGQDIRARRVHDIFILVPQEGPVAFELREVGLEDGNAGNDATGDERVVGAVVALGDELRLRSDAGHIGDVRNRMRAE